MKRLLSAFTALVLILSVFSSLASVNVSAATYRTAANSASSSYKNGVYYQNFQKIALTGDQRTDVVALAMSQVGYLEGNSDGAFSGTVAGRNNYTEYNYNMGNWGSGYTYEWCATFCSWALYQAQCTDHNSINHWCRRYKYTNSAYIWREVGCAHWADQLRYYGYFKYSKHNGGSYAPQPGDLIFYSWSAGKSNEDHIGLVVYSDSQYVYTIEGNTSDQAGLVDAGGGVFFKKYSLDYSYITGYGVLPYKTNSSALKIDYSGNNPSLGYYVNPNTTKSVYSTETGSTVSYTLPRFSMFEVTQVCSNGRLKVKCTINGSSVTGYVTNDSNRVVQITASAPAVLNMEVGQYTILGSTPLLSTASASASTLVTVPKGEVLSVTSIVDNTYGYTQYGDYKGYIKLDSLVQRTGSNDLTKGVTFTCSDLRYADNDYVVSWGDVTGAAGYSCKVVMLDGEPDPGNSDEANNGVVLYDNTQYITQTSSITIPAASIENGKYLKIAVKTSYPGASVWKSMYVTPVMVPFLDVSPTSWMYEAVLYCYENGLMNGVSSNKFSPDNTASISMLVKTLHIVAGSPEPSEDAVMPYENAKSTSYYYKSLLWCVENGIIRTSEMPTFDPNASVTREMAMLYVYRVTDRIGKNDKKLDANVLDGYTDTDSISDSCRIAMQWAVGKGLMTGHDNELKPQNNTNRAQLATILKSADTFVKELEEFYNPLTKGDIDNNGVITTTDYLCLESYINGSGSIVVTMLEAADLDIDGSINTTDYVVLEGIIKN